jgi:hypothetical protein
MSVGLVANASPLGHSRDPHASLFQLAGIKGEQLMAQYLAGDVTGQTGDYADSNIGCAERSAVHRALQALCDQHMGRHL